jgi:hypothetical protein
MTSANDRSRGSGWRSEYVTETVAHANPGLPPPTATPEQYLGLSGPVEMVGRGQVLVSEVLACGHKAL